MQLLGIAFRNLKRAPARTALSIVAVGAAVIAVLLLKGTLDGMLSTMEGSTIRFTAGHVRVIDREYARRERLLSLQYPVDGFDGSGVGPMVAALRALPEVVEVAPRLRFGGMVSRDDHLRHVLVVGGEPEVEAQLLGADRYLAEGRFYGAGRREAVLGRRLLHRLGMEVGDRFTLVFISAFGALRGYSFDVVGAFESSLAYLDDGTVFIPLDVAQEATDLGDGVTEIAVLARGAGQTGALLASVEGLLAREGVAGRYQAIPWTTHNELIQLLQMARYIYDGIYYLMLVLASFVIINTFLMIVHERRREIGLLSALGLRPGKIRLLFLLEGGLCGLFGSLAGVLVGAPLLWLLSSTGIAIPGVESLDAELMYPSTIYPLFAAGTVRFAFVGGIVVTLLATYLPARQAAALRPTEALRM